MSSGLPTVICVECYSTDIVVRTRHFKSFFYCNRCDGIRKVKYLPQPPDPPREGS